MYSVERREAQGLRILLLAERPSPRSRMSHDASHVYGVTVADQEAIASGWVMDR
jgi:hypothetical protein